MSDAEQRSNPVARLWRALRRPSARYSLLTRAGGGFIAGIIFWGGFHTAIEMSNTFGFCTSCHEMSAVYEEYKKTPHYTTVRLNDPRQA